MDPAWVVSIAMLVLAIGTGLFAVRQSYRARSRRDDDEHDRLYARIQQLEERTFRLEQENEKLR